MPKAIFTSLTIQLKYLVKIRTSSRTQDRDLLKSLTHLKRLCVLTFADDTRWLMQSTPDYSRGTKWILKGKENYYCTFKNNVVSW